MSNPTNNPLLPSEDSSEFYESLIEGTDVKQYYDVLSPDGFSISACNVYASVDIAKREMKKWIKRYEHQGYYSCRGSHIHLDELEQYCVIKPLDMTFQYGELEVISK